ncbi:MAG TPA: hypothetical protein PLH83_06010 [Ruminococcus sp.]|nr:hypothetical protein [Ruminococcus sp.]
MNNEHQIAIDKWHERGGVSIGVNDTDKRSEGWHRGYYTLSYRRA